MGVEEGSKKSTPLWDLKRRHLGHCITSAKDYPDAPPKILGAQTHTHEQQQEQKKTPNFPTPSPSARWVDSMSSQ